MESLRKQALQRELDRIEAEAREHSMTAINYAAELEAAEQLCVIINAGMHEADGLRPTMVYYGTGDARVAIYTHGRAANVLQRVAEADLEWEEIGDWGSDAYKELKLYGFDGVHVVVESTALANYLASLAIEKAAA